MARKAANAWKETRGITDKDKVNERDYKGYLIWHNTRPPSKLCKVFNGKGCSVQNCTFVHRCDLCRAEHSRSECKRPQPQAPTSKGRGKNGKNKNGKRKLPE